MDTVDSPNTCLSLSFHGAGKDVYNAGHHSYIYLSLNHTEKISLVSLYSIMSLFYLFYGCMSKLMLSRYVTSWGRILMRASAISYSLCYV